jgi:methylenetetrahydrofolate dehydrogenase (NADP+)/methenyltetrahydrofolate cyclohydrolase
MPAKLIDGKKLSEEILAKVGKRVSKLSKKPVLAVVLVGDSPASHLYVEKKRQVCEKVGVQSKLYSFCESVSQEEVVAKVKELNEDNSVNGILVQLPLPKNFDRNTVLEAVSPSKDVDGFSAENLGKLALGIETMVSCTASGIIKMIESTGTELKGKNCCIVNHSIVVGKPLTMLLLNRNATVSVCHQFTKNLAEFTKNADVLITAAGVPCLIKKEMVKAGSIVIDAGIAKNDGKLCGDVEFDSVKEIVSAITPVPGGVGPMTIACLIENTVKAAENQ